MAEKKKSFRWRGWTTFVLTISFIVDTVSGIILYISPPGRIANWTNWTVWGLTKEAWSAIHTIFGYVLLIIAALHLYYNWKIFIGFLWSKLRKAMNLKWELLTATLVCLIVFVGTLWEVPPFSSTMKLGEYFKEGWEESKVDVPMAHAELLSLEKFAQEIDVPLGQIVTILKEKGYQVDNDQQTLGEIAEQNKTSPDKLYEDIKSGGATPNIPETIEGSGLGKKSLETICMERNLSLEQVLAKLKQRGVEAKPDDKLKDVASKLEMTPIKIFNLLTD